MSLAGASVQVIQEVLVSKAGSVCRGAVVTDGMSSVGGPSGAAVDAPVSLLIGNVRSKSKKMILRQNYKNKKQRGVRSFSFIGHGGADVHSHRLHLQSFTVSSLLFFFFFCATLTPQRHRAHANTPTACHRAPRGCGSMTAPHRWLNTSFTSRVRDGAFF